MKIFNLTDFTKSTLKDFTEFSNEHWDEPWLIYLESKGGRDDITSQILSIVNLKQKSSANVSMNVSTAYSNGFRFVIEFNGPITILDECMGMWHIGRRDNYLLLDGSHVGKNSDNYADVMSKDNEYIIKKDLKIAKRFLNKDQLKMYKDGKDVYFTDKEMREFVDKK